MYVLPYNDGCQRIPLPSKHESMFPKRTAQPRRTYCTRGALPPAGRDPRLPPLEGVIHEDGPTRDGRNLSVPISSTSVPDYATTQHPAIACARTAQSRRDFVCTVKHICRGRPFLVFNTCFFKHTYFVCLTLLFFCFRFSSASVSVYFLCGVRLPYG